MRFNVDDFSFLIFAQVQGMFSEIELCSIHMSNTDILPETINYITTESSHIELQEWGTVG